MTRWLDQWPGQLPGLRGVPRDDAAALAEYTRAGEAVLAGLPGKPGRDEQQRVLAQRVLTSCRELRDRFINLHAEHVYDTLTAGRCEYHRVSELVFAAADRFPGLVPTRAQLDAERVLAQAHKDGREIDQGIFFRGLLRSPAVGAHLIDGMLMASPRARELLAEFRVGGRLDLGTVLIERRRQAAYLTVHNEHCLNAEDNALIDDMETAVDLALLDDQVRVGVLRGGVMSHPRYRGRRVFSAGINLRDLHDGRISFVDFLLRRELGYINKLVRGLLADPVGAGSVLDRAVSKPWVAVVDSFAIGGGMQLLLVADRVIAADDSYFSLPAAREGIVPGVANLRLTRLVGSRLARQIILSGRKISATEPAAELVCDEVVPTARLDAAVDAAVRLLDSPAVVANRRMLNLAEEPPEQFRAYLAEFAVSQALRLYSEDVLAKISRAKAKDSTASVAELVRRWAASKPDELAIVDESGPSPRTWTWRELSRQADQIGTLLLRLGVRPGEVVALQLPNWGESVVAALAILRVGAVCCPLLPTLGPRETHFALNQAGVRVLVVSAEQLARPGRSDDPVEHAVVIGPGQPPAVKPRVHLFHTGLAIADVDTALIEARCSQPDRYGQLAFTSGTTGQAKPVLHRVDTLTRAVRLAAAHLHLTDTDRVIVVSPLGHHSGFLYGMWLAWVTGCTQIVQGSWDADRALAVIARWDATFTQLATPLLVDLVNAVNEGAAAPASLRICVVTGAAVPDRLAEQASHALGTAVCRAWGSTETCMGTLSTPADPPTTQWQTDGLALDGVRLRVTNDAGTVLGPGVEGNLQVHSPCMFAGYGMAPKLERNAFTEDGWYQTGDLAVIDESGRLRVTGRTSDVVNRGGEKVPVLLIENLLAGHEAVADVAIAGMRDARLGERACAFVVVAADHKLSLGDLQRYLELRGVTKHYWPERLEVVESLPRNAAGKVRKFVLRQALEGVT